MKPPLHGRTALVIGAKRTGAAVARYLASRGARVRLSDRAVGAFDDERRSLAGLAVEWCLGREDAQLLEGVELVIPSPGVARGHALLRAAAARGVTILAEVELASRGLSAPLYAVTGTNGKSTTTELLGRMMRQSGKRVFIGGNLGTPLVDAVGPAIDCAVAEVSSFQLEWVDQLRPAVGIFLNLSDDHLDRYTSLDDYGETKAALFHAQTPQDWAVLSREDRWVWELRQRLRARVISFGFDPVEYGTFPRDGTIVVRLPDDRRPDREVTFSMARSRLRGIHNLENVMAASTAALLAGAPPEAVQATIDEFPGLPHRLQLVREKEGVRYVDDSKGTNVGAVVKSLASMTGPVILLAGGVDKGGSYEPLRRLVHERVKRLIVFGQARETIRGALGAETETVVVSSLEEAVARAGEIARTGDTVLLSPACASFDMFRDYAARGERFRALVEAL
ncbi:MAG: UDP-N-acetylmuramoyl-L-alanine--D-glutamate ligase [Deltaproteobacteria bacterium]|nr:UDP-N-acetylmuramoyl-L-alanine--D-glutamate ligase [Deltaproteobacteria bacterium]